MAQRSSLLALYLTRIREFYRQPARIFWVYGFPTVLAIGLGLAFRSRPPEPVRVDMIQGEADPGFDALLAKLQGRHEGQPPLIVRPVTPGEADERIRNGDTTLVIEPLGGKTGGDRPEFRYRFDPTRPESAMARLVADDALQRAFGRSDPVAIRDRTIEEPGSRYIDFLIPGLIALNTMGGGLWGIGFLLVNFRIAKLLKRFMATPMPRRNFLLAILGARLTFLIPDAGSLLLLGVWMFAMPIRGSMLLFALVEVVGALAFAGIGLLVASRARSTESVSGLMNLVMLPQWLFSGIFFKSDHFPDAIQPLIQALPLTQLVDALRQIVLRGAGFVEVAPALAILAAWAVGTFWIALRIFRWT